MSYKALGATYQFSTATSLNGVEPACLPEGANSRLFCVQKKVAKVAWKHDGDHDQLQPLHKGFHKSWAGNCTLPTGSKLSQEKIALFFHSAKIGAVTFREAYSKKFSICESKYQKHLFWKSLHRRTYPFVWLLEWWTPAYFEEDMHAIEELGGIKDLDYFDPEVGRFYGRNQRSKSFLRRRLKLRVSGERLIKLKQAVYRQSTP